MKKLCAILILCAFLAGCTSSTPYGECIGAFDERNPGLIYKLDAMNIAMAVIFFELVLPPIFVIVDETFCPVGVKHKVPEFKQGV